MTMTASDRAIEPPVAKESDEIAAPGPAELTVAAIGASAGGLDALCAFFDHMPAQSGVAFVVVTHHHPKAPSLLPQILARHTRMPVVDARHRMELRADRVHVIPPGAGAALEDGRLLLDGVRAQERLVHPIDAFFRSVAREQGDRAIGVVLSGTGCDGSRGAEEIRRAGGLTIAQDAGAAYREMPENAIAAGGIQQVLPVEECARAIAAHAARRGRATPRGAVDPLGADTENGALLAAVAARLRSVTGQDLTDYKEAVIRRRLGHRMLLRRIGSLAEYVRVLEAEPQEVEALWRAMLIGVTSFFRDPAAFESLGRALDELLAVKPANEVVRVWVAGCATGEEAFSIAIALRESMERIGRDFPVRVTATDLDPAAVEVARAGSFPEGAIAPLGPERVARFFLRQPGRYAIHPDILGQIEFSARPLADPPPFSDREPADLVSCRNVLIYLTDAAQRATLALLHAALRPGGLLLLGRAERLGPLADRFEAVDQRWRIYRRTLSPGRAARRPAGPARPAPEPEEVTHAGIARLVAADFGPASALVDAAGEILQVHGAAA
ncbi:MAG TPA: chemotaxis protein CheB, partial [Kofleriaceae bacterium]|nr:chemotaxis protein CheB [Kofleriaceae bacterium]